MREPRGVHDVIVVFMVVLKSMYLLLDNLKYLYTFKVI